MTQINVALFNYQNGGLRPDGYDFRPLQHAFSAAPKPALILLCEGKRYRANGGEALHWCAEALADECGGSYIPLPGTTPRGPIGPVILYDPTILTLRNWRDGSDPDDFTDQHNTARFAVKDSGPTRETRTRELLTWVDHWDPRSGNLRLQQAQLRARYGNHPLPTLCGGDLNSTASGPHLPQRDWAKADHHTRGSEGHHLPDGTWTADTRAVDHLIGTWTNDHRVDGHGYHAIAELARPAQTARPTTNPTPGTGGEILKDFLLVNDAMLPHLAAGSYHVHTPTQRPYPSDHRLVTATIDL